jgi:transposase
MERMMKLQDVLLKAMAKKITWWDAAEIIGVTDRTMRRWRERLEEHGYSGLGDRRRGKPSPRRIGLAVVERVLGLYKETYYDLNIRHFHEKLKTEHQIELSYTWVQQALQGAGLVARHRKRGKHRRRRERRPMAGMLLHIDGSKHRWLGGQRWHDLIVILDDATSEIYYAQLVEEESTRTVMAGLREVIETQGLFCALYSDRGSHFFVTPKAGEKVDKHRLTQVGRAMRELGVQMIPAYSPQARGRSERSFGTWQGRLPQELRLAKIETMEGANAFLRQSYMAEFNEKFTVTAKQKGTAFRKTARADLNWIFAVQNQRIVDKDNTGDDGRKSVADRQELFSKHAGWLHGDDPRTLRPHRFDPIWTARSGTIRRSLPAAARSGKKAGGMSRIGISLRQQGIGIAPFPVSPSGGKPGAPPPPLRGSGKARRPRAERSRVLGR